MVFHDYFLCHSLAHHWKLIRYISLKLSLQKKMNTFISCWSWVAPTWQRHCSARTSSLLLFLKPFFCFTYPLLHHKKALRFQNLLLISSSFLYGLLILKIFISKRIICNLAFCEIVSKKSELSKWPFLSSGSFYQQFCFVMPYIN